MYQKTKSPTKNWLSGPKKSLLIFACVIVLLAVAIAVLEVTNKTHLFHARQAVSGVIPSTSSNGSAPSTATHSTDKSNQNVPSSPVSNPPENQKQGDQTTTPAPTGSAPLTPFGNFISNHAPNLDGDPAPSSMESVCNTSPGAQCSIELTNADGVVKTLAAQTADTNGATYWSWDVKKAGLTVGSWKIKVIAKLHNQTATATSAQNLEVGP